ncbi:MAG: ATP-binding protein [Nanoarchaeota archaeon]
MSELLETLIRLNPWWSNKPFETGLARPKYFEKIKKYLETKEIVVLTGVRRGGKTTLLFQIINYLINERKVNSKNILFVNFDDAGFINIENPIQSIMKTFTQEISDAPSYIIFDEIQNVTGWERWAKTVYDEKKHNIVLSGSSAHIIDSKLATLISGRYLQVTVFPLDFQEFLYFNNLESLKNKIEALTNKNKILSLLKKYIVEGGFPKVTLQKDEALKNEQLKNYYDSILYKDIISLHNIRNTKSIQELIYFLCSNVANLYSYKGLSDLLKIDFTTLKEYISYIEESRILFSNSIFSYSLKTQSRNNKKIYCIDNGLRNAVSFVFSKDEGKLAENLVFTELKRRGKDSYYWQNKGEVDFVIKNKNQTLTAINVTYSDNVDEREINSLLEFKSAFKKTSELILLTKDTEKKEKGIQFIPLWKWLLFQ